MENLSTRIPTDRAAMKCPNSWMVINTPRIRIVAQMIVMTGKIYSIIKKWFLSSKRAYVIFHPLVQCF